MNRQTVGVGAAVLALMVTLAACSSSGSKAAPPTTKARATTTTRPATTSTTAASSSTTSAAPPVTAPVTGPTTPPPGDPQTAAMTFFSGWVAHQLGVMIANGTGSATHQAIAQYAHTYIAGSPWEFSNCQGAAGSTYCTWVRPAEDAVVRASSVNPANRVVEFQYHALDALGIAGQLLDAWQFDATNAIGVLADNAAGQQLQALSAHRRDGWQAPSQCSGTAGSFYCTFTAGTHQLRVRVGDVQMPHQVIEVTYQ